MGGTSLSNEQLLDLYKFEIERHDVVETNLQTLVGWAAAVGTGLWSLTYSVVSERPAHGAVALCLVVAAASVGISVLTVALVYIFRAHLMRRYHRLGPLSDWIDFAAKAHVVDDAAADAHIAKSLAKRCADARDQTAEFNKERGLLLRQARTWSAVALLPLALLAAVRVVLSLQST